MIAGFSLKFEADPSYGWPSITKHFGKTGYTYNFSGYNYPISSEIVAIRACFSFYHLDQLDFKLEDGSIVSLTTSGFTCSAGDSFVNLPGTLIGLKYRTAGIPRRYMT